MSRADDRHGLAPQRAAASGPQGPITAAASGPQGPIAAAASGPQGPITAAARGLDAFSAEAARIDGLIEQWHEQGLAVDQIAAQVGELNTALFARLWSQLAPADLVANSCLLVMGSEGRGEQILKTDQDNALLLGDGFACAEVEPSAQRFNQALKALGYPPCPGDIMLTNPLWQQALADFKDSLRGWVYGDDPLGPMRLAIFFDSRAVAGNAALLVEARDYLDRILVGSDSFMARFASAVELFEPPRSWWQRLTGRLDERPLDLKKLGIFPIVHGVRAMALQQRLRVNGTAERLKALVEQQQIDAALAGEVVQALHRMRAIRLHHQLRQKRSGQAPDNLVRPSDLQASERAPLHDALAVVRRFREMLRRRFRLDAL